MTARTEYSPFERLSRFPGVVASPNRRSRRLARSGGSLFDGVATDLVDQCSGRINPTWSPPTPPHDENPATGGQTERAKRRSIGFFNDGQWGVCRKPVEIVVTHRLCHVAVRTPPPRVAIEYPRVVPFSPRVRSFYPRVGFCSFAAIPVSLSLFSLVKEEEREGHAGKLAIHGFCKPPNTHSTGRGLHPRVFGGCFFKQNPTLARVCGVFGPHPRIHGLKCLYLPDEGSQ